MKSMESLQDLIEEAKLRTVWWALCIFAVSYFLAHTSKSMWMNVPIAILLVSGSRILLNKVELRWKIKKTQPQTYLSHLEKKQLSVNDSRLSTLPPPPKWKRKIDSPVVEAAMEDFINKLLQDFVVDLWYTDITPDKEGPELIRAIIMDALAEISARVKNINLVDLLTRDVVDLVGVHLELFRKNQSAIGVEVMVTLSSEERDERLKHHLMASNKLHPALLSPESEYKFLKRIVGAVLAVVLKPREAQSALVRCIARELLTCLVMEPVMRFASPAYINELLELIFLASANEGCKEASEGQSGGYNGQKQDQSTTTSKTDQSFSQKRDVAQEHALDGSRNIIQEETKHLPSADWARGLEAATQRRTEVLQPENLENMWTKGRNYKKKAQKNAEKNAAREPKSVIKKETGNEMLPKKLETSTSIGVQIPPKPHLNGQLDGQRRDQYYDGGQSNMLTLDAGVEESSVGNDVSKTAFRKSNSTSDLYKEPVIESAFAQQVSGSIISEFYSANVGRHDEHNTNTISDKVLRSEGYSPKLKCRVLGAYFEKLGSKSFAVYSIAVTDAENNTWFVKRRYRNFERLHRQLKDIPNYTLHLPPKRIFSSNTEDTFVHQRCIQLDKYLQDLLSIANVAEQHEVWDFLSISSKNYSFGKSSSVMRTLAVNVDDAVDDIVRQFKGVSDGLMRKVVGPTFTYEPVSSAASRSLTWKTDELSNSLPRQATSESANSLSDNEMGSNSKANGWHSDNELNSKGFPPRVVKHDELLRSLDFEKRASSGVRSEILNLAANFPSTSDRLEDMPAEWTPPNVSVPLLNLVDKIFQLNKRGWLRRQVFWISKQILQLMMEDAIDDWLLRQIHWLRRDDIVAHGIHWIQDVLWPEGVFFTRVNTQNRNGSQSDQDSPPPTSHSSGSKVNKQGLFEEQLEAARRASDVKKMIFNGAPTTLVSLIGHNQYKRCAKDVYYFLQSDVCLKQLAYGLLELVIITVFPELHDVITDVHEKKQTPQV